MMSKMKSIVNTIEAKSVSKVEAMVNSIEKQAMSSSFSAVSPDADTSARIAALEEVRTQARFAKVMARRKLNLVCENIGEEGKHG